MRSTDDYRRRAVQARRLAEGIACRASRTYLLEVADIWQRLAGEAMEDQARRLDRERPAAGPVPGFRQKPASP